MSLSFRRIQWTASLLTVLVGLGACQTTKEAKVPDGFSVPPLAISSPRELLGRGGGDLRAALGEPALLRKETPAQVWQYQGRTCVLDFFLYEEDGQVRVIHTESRERTGGVTRPDLCLQDVHRSRYLSTSGKTHLGV
ncbi:MAG: hypothetical protein K9H25_02010 [Rhodospirillum sp.]|nr:hypothetical protein [Rhodospirillum sp.]MCF8487902.1 hypothetical protein [Rhodospirillum sp.]MCF8501454.1 hypothetical protein [Rhodospirillum sp.]